MIIKEANLLTHSRSINIGIVGFGSSGRRFHRCLNHLNKTHGDLNLIGIYDNQEIATLPKGMKIVKIDDITTFLKKLDIVIVTTNDHNHEEIFERLDGTNINVISEKPLTSNLDHCKMLESVFLQRKIYVNYTERFSPVLNDCRDFIEKRNVIITRAIFFWGKDRYFDKRPTIGVYSEITHPIDLILYLFKFNDPSIEILNFSKSFYTISESKKADSIDLILNLNSPKFCAVMRLGAMHQQCAFCSLT